MSDEIDWKDVESSNVLAVSWSGGNLYVKYKDGGMYRYRHVQRRKYIALLGAESIGKFIARNIKGKHPSESIGQDVHVVREYVSKAITISDSRPADVLMLAIHGAREDGVDIKWARVGSDVVASDISRIAREHWIRVAVDPAVPQDTIEIEGHRMP